MNNKLNFTFLTREQVFGISQLDILKKCGTKCDATDFSAVLNCTTVKCYGKSDKSGYWWTKSLPYRLGNEMYCVDIYGNDSWLLLDFRRCGARPVITYSSIKSACSNEVINDKGIKEVLYGEYPQTMVNESFFDELEKAYNNGNLKKTGKTYTTPRYILYATDNPKYSERPWYYAAHRTKTNIEYEYEGKKYIRYVGNACDYYNSIYYKRIGGKKVYWICVEPITWLVDEKEDIALSKNILFAGIPFVEDYKNYNGVFEESTIKKFMDKYFSKDIEKKNQNEQSNKKTSDKKKSKQNKLEKIKRLDKKIEQLKNTREEVVKQTHKEIKQSKETRKEIDRQSHNQKVYTNSGKKKHK